MTLPVNYHVRLRSQADLEEFANCIKDAVVSRLAPSERFGAIRLKDTPVHYNDWMHRNLRGFANEYGIEVRQTESALQLAGTVIHELGHTLVGVAQQHSQNWYDACQMLGLTCAAHVNETYAPAAFAPDILAAIEAAILRLFKERPTLVFDPNIVIPFPQGREPMPFQVDGIKDMLEKHASGKNILLADEMGLGKTVEVMGFINVTHPTRILVGCPNNAKLIWRDHFRDWCIHNYDVEVAYTQLYTFGDVVIMNYEAMVKWADALKSQKWDLVVYDEGHYLKTPSAKRSQAAYSVAGTTEIIVTGTPIVNYPYELFPLIHYLDRDNWPEYGRFEAAYGSRGSSRLGYNLNRLNSKLRSTIMVRRFKKDVMSELPRKRRAIIQFEVSDDVRKLIEKEKELFHSMRGDDFDTIKMLNAMKNESDTTIDDVDWHALILSLTQTRRFAFEEMARIAHQIGRAKLPLVLEHIENALEAREKVVVFGHHRDVLEAIHERFKSESVLLYGGHANQAEITQQAAERFNNNDTCRLFVGGVSIAQGYSLKGGSNVIFVEEDWVPGVMTQAEDRSHGIGRGDADAASLLIQHLVFEDSLDTYKAQLTIRKQKSIDKATGKLCTITSVRT